LVTRENAPVPVRRYVAAHLESRQVSRVIYGSTIGLALVVALEAHPPSSGVMVATLLGTAIAVGLAELYSEVVGAEASARRRITREEVGHVGVDIAAVASGIVFPSVFFILATAGVLSLDTAFEVAKWSGLGLIGLYGFAGARLSGAGLPASLAQAAAVALIGGFLIALKALIH
jgi:hypothetical protein